MKKLLLISTLFLLFAGVAYAQNQYTDVFGSGSAVFSPTNYGSWSAYSLTNYTGFSPAQNQQLQQNASLNGTNPCTPGNSATTRQGNLSYCPLEPLYPMEQLDINSTNSFPRLIDTAFKILIALGALIAVVTMVIGGVMYMTTEVTHTKDAARHRMLSSVYGLVLLAASFLILNTINPQLTFIKLQPGIITGQQPNTNNTGLPITTQIPPTQTDFNNCQQQLGVIQMQPNGSWSCSFSL
ncbi:pilin [Candidatus Parcubacteria bacterium]|nr:pilin [Candidatus Parcubacteria bacterium]